jgi:trehalose-6-phosphate synthase
VRFRLRLIVLLASGITLVALLVAWSEVRAQQFAVQLDLQERTRIGAEWLREIVEPLLQSGSTPELPAIVERFGSRERLGGVAVFDGSGQPLAISSTLSDWIGGQPAIAADCSEASLRGCGAFTTVGVRPMYVYTIPLYVALKPAGVLTIFSDAGAISDRAARVWRNALTYIVPQVLLMVLITYLVVQSTVLAPIARTARWIKDLRFGVVTPGRETTQGDLLEPISSAAASLAKSLASAQASAEEEARLREAGDSLWTPERLRVAMQRRLRGTRLFVVSNREPYEHVHRGKTIAALVPASGVVTALEPVLCACDGTWIAHGSGDADRAVVDQHCRVRVPPDESRYTLRRVWLSKEEENGYYFGFANEGLWPLCHIAHTRPIFRASDWEHYQKVNRRFAEAVLEEIEDVRQPVLLIQDYHFALLPRLIKEVRPDARVAMFWHIPWPNPEAFGICPWQHELLDGLLGADLVSFHIQAHCDNFLETLDRSLECRIEWERFAVKRRQHLTLVRPHPISVAFPETHTDPSDSLALERSVTNRVDVHRRFGVEGGFLGVGVDRVDYTKGIIERFRGVERFLEMHSIYRGAFTFVQIGAPSRTHIRRYQDLLIEVRDEAERINRRFRTERWQPIHLLTTQHSHEQIAPLYKAADVCLVTSLHDGMNLVAKEFVASRDDEDGVLILSEFTGACRELTDALHVNPYDIEQLAEAIRAALEMPADDRRARMQHMRRTVRDRNVYRWAAELISELTEMRPARAADAMTVH